MKPKRSLTVEQASVLIGKCLNGVPIPRRTMTTFISRGLPCMKLGKRLWFARDEVLAWVKKHKRGERCVS